MNRLESETSPYLRQHAANPVDWYPWGEEAFERARQEDRPVLLSVGYSACHWCHVMAHESFEDEATAEEINRSFVAIKVDREERPDVDAVYMEAVQALTGRGGWPMTVFLTPDGRPFFGGTYFPITDTPGMPSFRRVLASVDDAWRNRRSEVLEQADTLAQSVIRRSQIPAELIGPSSDPADPRRSPGHLMEVAMTELESRFDATGGGFGPAPKFPQPSLIELCLCQHRLTADERTLTMVTTTLDAMACGGIYDHLGGGFARYSTDDTWTVPHFEKMLYDQAGMVRAYVHAWQVTGAHRWLAVVDETISYVLRDLAAPQGGLYSAQDADSEGEEGKFYLWTRAEIDDVLGPELGAVAASFYGVTGEGNFEGSNILRRPAGPSNLDRPGQVEDARAKLLAARARRVAPGLDDKVLTEWNAMFGSALAEAAAATGRADWKAAACKVGQFLLDELHDGKRGRLLRSWHGGTARHLAYAADYAHLVDFLTRLAELTGEPHWLDEALHSARQMLSLFGGDGGVLFTTGTDAEKLVVRPIDVFDGAVPSANSVAAIALVRLGALTGDAPIAAAGEALLVALSAVAAEHPLALANVVTGSALTAGGVTEVVVAGERPDLVATVQGRFEPTAVVAWGQPTASPLWADRADGKAYVCRRYTCASPAEDVDELSARLEVARSEDTERYVREHRA